MSLIFAVPASESSSGRSFLAINSDRLPNESQSLVRYVSLPFIEPLALTAQTLELDGTANEMLIGRPYNQWGAEMGVNQHGLAITVSTVVTKFKSGNRGVASKGLTGQEMLRLCLSFCTTPAEAADRILHYQQQYGLTNDPGIIAYEYLHGYSFVLASATEMILLELANDQWVKKTLRSFHAIAGAFSVADQFDAVSQGAEELARSRKWLGKKRPFHFAEAFGLRKVMRQSKAEPRANLLHAYWAEHKQDFDRQKAFSLLQMHLPAANKFNPSKVKMASPEQFATGKSNPWQTVNSMVAEFQPDRLPIAWFTGTSSPSTSLFKPFVVPGGNMVEGLIKEPGSLINESLWWKAEVFHRVVMANYQNALLRFQHEQQALQLQFNEKADQGLHEKRTSDFWQNLSQECLRIHLKKVLEWNYDLKKNPLKGYQFSPFYKKYLEELTRKAKPLLN